MIQNEEFVHEFNVKHKDTQFFRCYFRDCVKISFENCVLLECTFENCAIRPVDLKQTDFYETRIINNSIGFECAVIELSKSIGEL